jgi:hypothetical protein
MWGRRYVPPESGRTGVEDVVTGLEGRVQSAAATAGTGVAAESWMRARKVKARPRMKARNEGILKDAVFWMMMGEAISVIECASELTCQRDLTEGIQEY